MTRLPCVHGLPVMHIHDRVDSRFAANWLLFAAARARFWRLRRRRRGRARDLYAGETHPPTTETTAPTDTESNPATETLPNDGDGTGTGDGTTAPEGQTGGAGDEEPAQIAGAVHRQGRAHHAAHGPGAGLHLDPRRAALSRRQRVRADVRRQDDQGRDPAGTRSRRRFDGLQPDAKLVGTRPGRAATWSSRPPPSQARRRRHDWLASQPSGTLPA